jgi:hypothetical protein
MQRIGEGGTVEIRATENGAGLGAGGLWAAQVGEDAGPGRRPAAPAGLQLPQRLDRDEAGWSSGRVVGAQAGQRPGHGREGLRRHAAHEAPCLCRGVCRAAPLPGPRLRPVQCALCLRPRVLAGQTGIGRVAAERAGHDAPVLEAAERRAARRRTGPEAADDATPPSLRGQPAQGRPGAERAGVPRCRSVPRDRDDGRDGVARRLQPVPPVTGLCVVRREGQRMLHGPERGGPVPRLEPTPREVAGRVRSGREVGRGEPAGQRLARVRAGEAREGVGLGATPRECTVQGASPSDGLAEGPERAGRHGEPRVVRGARGGVDERACGLRIPAQGGGEHGAERVG